MKQSASARGWTNLFSLWALQGIAAAIVLLLLPSDARTGQPFSLSAARLSLLAAILLLTLAAGWLTWRTRQQTWSEFAGNSRVQDAGLLASIAIIFACESILLVLHGLSQGGLIFEYAAYASRLAPLLHLLSVSSFELILWILWLRRDVLKSTRPFVMLTAWIWVGLSAAVVVCAWTGLGVRPEEVGAWAKPTIPFWEWQILLVWAVGSALLYVELFAKIPEVPHLDRWIGLGIWIGVSVLWLTQPVNIGWLAGPRAPNFEPYPFSDALTYDQFAQSIVIGNGMDGHAIAARPLYVVFLAALHGLAGPDYSRTIALQGLVLALFPVALYFLGKELSGRPLGIMLALMAALRDVMSGLAADYAGNFSYSKFYLSELPTALLLTLFALFLIRGAKRPGPWNPNFMLAGGVLGLATLVRTQSLLLLPVAFLLAFLSNRKDWRGWFLAGVTVSVIAALVIAPWLWRNWTITGGILMDDPYSQMGIRATWYRGEKEFVSRLPGENDRDYSKRLMGIAIEGARTHPGLVAHLVSAHFINNEFGNLMVFPVRDGLEGLEELLRPTRAFWDHVELNFNPGQSALLGLYILLFSLGAAAAWRGAGWTGLMPLAVNLAYNFTNALFMSSGMRFLLVADWGFYFYYALGLLTLTRAILFVLSGTRDRLPSPETATRSAVPDTKFRWQPVLLGCAVFLLAGISLPLSEVIVPPRYPPMTREALIREIQSQAPAGTRGQLDALLADPDLVLARGRALYPRYYAAGEGETEKTGYKISDKGRLVFMIVGDAYSLVVLDLPDTPAFFPNTSDISLIARRESGYLQAQAVLVRNGDRSAIYFADGN